MRNPPFVARLLLSVFFVSAGLAHFFAPDFFVAIVPSYLPHALLLVYISGVAELAGGIAIQIPRLRKLAGWGLIALLVAVFPANIHAFQHGMDFAGKPVDGWVLLARLPLQVVFIYWVYWACCRARPETTAQ